MAMATVLNKTKLDDGLTAVADAIREKTGGTEMLAFPDGFTQAIGDIHVGVDEYAALDRLMGSQLYELVSDFTGTVADYTFRFHRELTRLIFNRAQGLGTYMCHNCSGLLQVYAPAATTVGTACFYGCSSLLNAYFPNVSYLSNQMFYGCTALRFFDAGNASVISTNAFQNCSGLETLILRFSTTNVTLQNTNAFTGTPIAAGTGYVYVPRALISQYENNTNWSSYVSQIRAIEDYPEICGGVAE